MLILLILLCAGISLYMLLAVDLFSHLFRKTGWSRFISTFLLFYAQIITTEFLLGLFSLLNNYNLVALNALISTGIVIILKRKFGKKIFTDYLAGIRQLIVSVKKVIRKDPLWTTVLLLALAFVVWIIFLGLIFPIVDYDGNSYHMTFVAYLIQDHTFLNIITSNKYLAGYPKGGEFIQAWNVLITHNDMFADLTQVPFLILGVYALYEIAVTLGANKKHARFSATLFVFLPIVLNQLKTTYVDVMICSLFFAGLAMVIKKKLSKLDLVLIGIIFSLLISIKSTGPLFVLVLLPILFWNLYQNYGKTIRNYIKPMLLMLSPTFFGLFWYIRDYILYGSPIYPFGLKLAGLTIFHGMTFQQLVANAIQSTSLPNGCVQRLWFVWTEQKGWFGCLYNYDTNYAGLGPIWFIILIPAIIISVYFAIKKRNAKYLAITATIFALFAIYPSNYYSRYTMFIVAVGVFALGIVLTNISKVTANLVKILAIILVISVIATNFNLCNFTPQVVRAQIKSLLAGTPKRGGAIYPITVGKAFVFIEERVKPNEVIEYDSKPFFIYPLWRPDYKNIVIYFPANNEDTWYKEVANKHVKYVFTTLHSKENRWAKDRMKVIYKDNTYEIFQAY